MRTHARLSPFLLGLVAVLAFGLVGCAEEAEVESVDDTAVMEEPMPEAMPAPAAPAPGTVDVGGTIAALQGGITAVPMNAALDNINGWISQLQGADFEGADDIVDELEELRDELQATPIDGDDVGESLTELGRMTAEAATAAGNAELQQLADLLSGAGNQLTGGM